MPPYWLSAFARTFCQFYIAVSLCLLYLSRILIYNDTRDWEEARVLSRLTRRLPPTAWQAVIPFPNPSMPACFTVFNMQSQSPVTA